MELAAIHDVAVEEGLEPPLPVDPGWHLLEDKHGVKRWKAFDPEMQRRLESMLRSGRKIARFTGSEMSEMDGSASSLSSNQHRDRYEVSFPAWVMTDLITKRDQRVYRAPGALVLLAPPPRVAPPRRACCRVS